MSMEIIARSTELLDGGPDDEDGKEGGADSRVSSQDIRLYMRVERAEPGYGVTERAPVWFSLDEYASGLVLLANQWAIEQEAVADGAGLTVALYLTPVGSKPLIRFGPTELRAHAGDTIIFRPWDIKLSIRNLGHFVAVALLMGRHAALAGYL